MGRVFFFLLIGHVVIVAGKAYFAYVIVDGCNALDVHLVVHAEVINLNGYWPIVE